MSATGSKPLALRGRGGHCPPLEVAALLAAVLGSLWAGWSEPAAAGRATRLMEELVPLVVPRGSPQWSQLALAEVAALQSLCRLRADPAAGRLVGRLLGPRWAELLGRGSRAADAALAREIRAVVTGGEEGQSVVYALWASGHSRYVGKANLRRRSGPGFPARFMEHIRAVTRQPGARRLPAHSMWRQSGWRNLWMLPLRCFSTEMWALAAEGLLIQMTRPRGNTLGVTD